MSTRNGANTEMDQLGTEGIFSATTIFDDVLPEPVSVSLIEFKDTETGEKDDDGRPIIVRVPRRRVAIINTYVPMKVLHRMMASQERLKQVQGLQKQATAGALSEQNQEMMLSWMADQVLEVWKLTEPWMTAEKLTEGLSFQKVFGLFNLFFGDLLKQMKEQKLS